MGNGSRASEAAKLFILERYWPLRRRMALARRLAALLVLTALDYRVTAAVTQRRIDLGRLTLLLVLS
jgi:hypothetical protein